MTKLAIDAFRTIGPSDAIPNGYVVSYYLNDHKLRISIARVDDRLYAFDDLCTCTDQACPLSGGLQSRAAVSFAISFSVSPPLIGINARLIPIRKLDRQQPTLLA